MNIRRRNLFVALALVAAVCIGVVIPLSLRGGNNEVENATTTVDESPQINFAKTHTTKKSAKTTDKKRGKKKEKKMKKKGKKKAKKSKKGKGAKSSKTPKKYR